MSYLNPIFTKGVYGGLNRPVMQAMQRATEQSVQLTDGMRWAQAQVNAVPPLMRCLVQLQSATLVTANRWVYTCKIWHPTPPTGSGITVASTDLRFSYTTALNLREWHNTSTLVDGMNIATPASTIGPVGSVYSGAAWTTTELNAKVELVVAYDTAGNAFPFFDRPNPIRCT